MVLSQMSSITSLHCNVQKDMFELIEFVNVLTTCFQLYIEPNIYCTCTENSLHTFNTVYLLLTQALDSYCVGDECHCVERLND